MYGRAIGLNSHVIYAKNSYSCPYQYYGKKVDLRITDTQLEIYYQNERLQTHNKFPAYITNRYSTHEEDMPDKLKINDWDDERIRRWASKIGPSTTMVINRIFSSVTIKEQGYNSSLSVLRLSNLYSEARLETACEIALSKIKVPRYNHLKSILSTNQSSPPIKTCSISQTRLLLMRHLLKDISEEQSIMGGRYDDTGRN